MSPPEPGLSGIAWLLALPLATGFVGAASGAALGVLIARGADPPRHAPAEIEPATVIEPEATPREAPSGASATLATVAPSEPTAGAHASPGAAGQQSLERALEGMRLRSAERRAELLSLTRELERAAPPRPPAQLRRLRALADDPLLLPDVLPAIARLSGADSADLIFDVWQGARDRAEVARAAEALLYSSEVRAKASPALKVALDLGRAERCEDALRVLADARHHGDRRALKALVALTRRVPGCPENRFGDCNACVRRGTALRDAIAAVRERKPPVLR